MVTTHPMDDRGVVEVQINRPPRASVAVEARCGLGLPTVILVPPILDDGTPFPTTHWLTCPLATLRVSRLESAGGVREADKDLEDDETLAARYKDASDRYRRERDELIPEAWDGPRPHGGIAGSRGGVKCLHAQYADTVSGRENPIGARTAGRVGALDCTVPCVVEIEGVAVINPSWNEPT